MPQPAPIDRDQKVHVRRRYLHFAMVPVQLVKSKVISAQAVRAFALLDSYCSWDTNRAHPAHDRLADDMGVSVPTLRRAIKELVDAGYVSVEGTFDERGARTGTIYTLNDPQDVYGMHSMHSPEHDGLTPCSPVITPDSPSEIGTPCSPVITEVLANEQGPNHGRHHINTDTSDKMLLFPKDKRDASASGNPGSLSPSESQEINTARVRTQKTKTLGNPDIKPLLERHQQLYTGKIGAPLLLSWGRDGATMKRLLGVYSRAEVERLQDAYFAQPTDSFAGRQGYSVAEFAREVPALMTQIKANEELTESQRGLVEAIKGQGVREATALALVREFPEDEIQRQLRGHEGRRDSLRNPAAALVRAIREQWAVPEETEPDYFQPLTSVPAAPEGPPPEIDSMMARTVAHFTGKAAVSSGRR